MIPLNISIDDVSPHPMSSIRVLKQCERIIREFPEAKFTLFIPIAYWRTIGHTATSEPLWLHEHPDFCDVLRGLSKNNYELAYHGLHHGIPGKSNNDELQHLSYDAALGVIDSMLEGATKAGLFDAFKPIVRPPAWRMSPAAMSAFRDRGFRLFALSPDEYAMKTYENMHTSLNHVMYHCAPPQKSLHMRDDILEIMYHACEWDSNYFSDERTTELIAFLHENVGKYKLSFIEELVIG